MTESATLTTRTLSVSIVKDSGHYRLRVYDGNGLVRFERFTDSYSVHMYGESDEA